jgi:hypothetical protein
LKLKTCFKPDGAFVILHDADVHVADANAVPEYVPVLQSFTR